MIFVILITYYNIVCGKVTHILAYCTYRRNCKIMRMGLSMHLFFVFLLFMFVNNKQYNKY